MTVLVRWVLSCVFVISIAGCAQRTVEFRTKPTKSTVRINRVPRSGQAQTYVLPGATPLRHKIDFGGTRSVEVVLRKDDYRAKSISLSPDFIDSLPKENGVAVLETRLEQQFFQDVEMAEVIVDSERGLHVRIKTVRAFREDIEREGVPASRVLTVDDGAWIGALTSSPSDDRVAFSVVERVKTEEGKVFDFSTIHSVTGKGVGVTSLTRGRWLDTDPCFSHDGEHIYFASNRLRTLYLDLFRIGSQEAGGGIASIYNEEGWSRTPSAFADGVSAFCYVPEYFDKPSTPHIWTLGGRNQYPTQLMEGSDPEISPSGDAIIYIGPDRKLWKFSLVAQTPMQLTTNPNTHESDPTWSRDGNYILFVSNEGRDSTGKANKDIWVMRAEGTDKRQLTTNGSDDSKPVVNFDQKWIYFVSNRGYKWAIWRIPWPPDFAKLQSE